MDKVPPFISLFFSETKFELNYQARYNLQLVYKKIKNKK